jgi:foldase protein PrsA
VKRLLAVLACVLLFGAACTKPSGSRAAATVNGEEITNQSVVDELNAIGGNDDYLAALEKSLVANGSRVKGDAAGSYDSSFVTQVLQRQINYAIVHQELARRGVVADDSCKSSGRQDVYSTLGGGDTDKGKTVLAKFPEAYQDQIVTRDTDVLVLQATLSNQPCVSADAAKAYYDAHTADFEQACLSLIVLTDPAAADAVMAQLRGGADFATVAKASSTDANTAATGGDVGCVAKSSIPAQLDAAAFQTAIGEIADPVPTTTGTFIIKVNDRKSPAFADIESQAEELAASAAGQALNSWYNDAIVAAQISVDSRYGTWDATNGRITPPASATTTTVAPASDGGASIVTVPDTPSSS